MFRLSKKLLLLTISKFAQGFRKTVIRDSFRCNTARKIGIGSAFLLGLGCIHAIEDETIRNVRSLMNKHLNELRSEYGQTTVYP